MYKYNKIQNPSNPTFLEERHTPYIKIISNHEIEVSVNFKFITERDKKRKKFLYLCDENGDIIEERRLKKLENYNKEKIVEIFDINKINKKEKELVEIDDRDAIPHYKDIDDIYHAIFYCDIHGYWVDIDFPTY